MSLVVCIGELLVDWFPLASGQSLRDAEVLVKKPGGAPANVATVIAALGGEAALVSHVGSDPFGEWLREVVAEYGVDVRTVGRSKRAATAMAFVARLENGDRDFVFVHGADHDWSWGDAEQAAVESARVVHFGAATLQVSAEVREHYTKIMQFLYSSGGIKIISFDPNFREDLWKNKVHEWCEWVRECIPFCHVAKFSDEELLLITGAESLDAAMTRVRDWTNAVVLVTCGPGGAYALLENGQVQVPSVPLDGAVVDTTGAGDSFVAAVLWLISMESEPWVAVNIDRTRWVNWLGQANQVAGRICQQVGAMPVWRNECVK